MPRPKVTEEHTKERRRLDNAKYYLTKKYVNKLTLARIEKLKAKIIELQKTLIPEL